MSPKPPEICALPWLTVLEVRGPDAEVFSHSQLANDVKNLPQGHWQWNTCLSVQGRVIALFLLLKPASDALWLIVPDDLAETLKSHLERYRLRSKLDLNLRPELAPCGQTDGPFDRARPPAQGGALGLAQTGHTLELAGTHQRRMMLGDAPHSPELEAQWRAADIDDGLPWITEPTREAFIPQALQLDRLAAFSVSKGCYPGQEIVARTHFLGRNKRALARFELAGAHALPAGARLHDLDGHDESAIGVVLSAQACGDRTLGLAVMRDAQVAVGSIDGMSVSIRPLDQSPA